MAVSCVILKSFHCFTGTLFLFFPHRYALDEIRSGFPRFLWMYDLMDVWLCFRKLKLMEHDTKHADGPAANPYDATKTKDK
jgi:hypothetical protein